MSNKKYPINVTKPLYFGRMPEMPWKAKRTRWQRFIRWLRKLLT